MAVATSNRLFFISIISATSIAISVPEQSEIPVSARMSAGASLMPSPTIITFLPLDFNSETTLSLSCGSTSAITLSAFMMFPT